MKKRTRDGTKSPNDSPSPNQESTKKISVRNSTQSVAAMDEAKFRQIIGEELDKKLLPLNQLVPQVHKLSNEVLHLRKQVQMLERENRKRNIVIMGLAETDEETLPDRVKLFSDLMKKMKISGVGYDEMRRIGKPGLSNPEKPRPMLVKLIKMSDKIAIIKAKKELKGTKIYIDDHLTPDEQKQHATLRAKMKDLKKADSKTTGFVRLGILTAWIGGQRKTWHLNGDNIVEEMAVQMQS